MKNTSRLIVYLLPSYEHLSSAPLNTLFPSLAPPLFLRLMHRQNEQVKQDTQQQVKQEQPVKRQQKQKQQLEKTKEQEQHQEAQQLRDPQVSQQNTPAARWLRATGNARTSRGSTPGDSAASTLT